MNAPVNLSDLGRSIVSRLSSSINEVLPDVRSVVDGLCLSNDPSGLIAMFDAAMTAKRDMPAQAYKAVDDAYRLAIKKAYGYARDRGFVLNMPRLDGKGSVTAPTITPLDVDKATKQAASAELAEAKAKALAEYMERQEAAIAALTVSDLYASVVETASKCGADLADLAALIVAGLDEAQTERFLRNVTLIVPPTALAPDLIVSRSATRTKKTA
jgi:hypothetical protein